MRKRVRTRTRLHPEIAEVIAGTRRWCVITADCLDVLPTIPAAFVLITDPPYGIGYAYATYEDSQENLRRLVPAFITAGRAERVVAFPGINNLWLYPPADWVCSWSWNSTTSFGMAGYNMWQPVLLYGRDRDGFGNVDGVLKTDSVHFRDGNGIGFLAESKKANCAHPCPKPAKVMRWLVERFSAENDVVVDPFCGSGTTGVACIETGRRFIGIEFDPGYCKIASDRVSTAHLDPSLRKRSKGVYKTDLFGL